MNDPLLQRAQLQSMNDSNAALFRAVQRNARDGPNPRLSFRALRLRGSSRSPKSRFDDVPSACHICLSRSLQMKRPVFFNRCKAFDAELRSKPTGLPPYFYRVGNDVSDVVSDIF